MLDSFMSDKRKQIRKETCYAICISYRNITFWKLEKEEMYILYWHLSWLHIVLISVMHLNVPNSYWFICKLVLFILFLFHSKERYAGRHCCKKRMDSKDSWLILMKWYLNNPFSCFTRSGIRYWTESCHNFWPEFSSNHCSICFLYLLSAEAISCHL